MRNNLFNYGFKVDDVGAALWQYITAIYEIDNARADGTRMIPKLILKDLELFRPFAKLSVPRCMHVMSGSTASAMDDAITDGTLPIFAAPTSVLVRNVDNTFDALNSSRLHAKKELKGAITPTSPHKAFLESMAKYFSQLSTLSPQLKNPKNLPCLQAIQLTINSVLKLSERAFQDLGLKYLMTRRLNQDTCENMFSIIRGKGGHRTNPTPREFRSAMAQVVVDKLLIPPKGKNCEDDLNNFLFGLETIKSFGAETAIKSKLSEGFPDSPESLPKEVPDLTPHEQKIVSYMGGWVVRKLNSNKFCNTCLSKLSRDKASVGADERRHQFTMSKQYPELTPDQGLIIASDELLLVLDKAETSFLGHIDKVIHGHNVLYNLIARVSADTREQSRFFLCPKSVKCKLRISIVHVYVKCRMHFNIKQKVRSIPSSKSRY